MHLPIGSSRRPRHLLIVQANPFVARSLARYLASSFDAVDVVTDPLRVDDLLRDALRRPTHLVCGQCFGPDQPRGSDLVRRWREIHPDLDRVVVATSEMEPPEVLRAIDAVFLKPASPSGLLNLLE